MPTIHELTQRFESFLFAPRHGRGVCRTCFNFTDGYARCYACGRNEAWLRAVAPISYSVAKEQLHHALATYKRVNGGVARELAAGLAAVLWRFLERHECCLARAAGIGRFELVTTVPSGDPTRDDGQPLRRIVAEVVGSTRDRHERLLAPSGVVVPPHEFSREKYAVTRRLDGESVLLIDDTWTTGSNAQSAAAALAAAGAGAVAAVVIGRHLNREWHDNDRRLTEIPRPFNWDVCALCDPERMTGN